MKLVLTLISMSLLSTLFAQEKGTLTDPRDGQSYATVKLNGLQWMIENLRLETERSFGFNEEQKAQYPHINGRWYHMNELDSVCPEGWRLPTSTDWIGYLKLLAEENNVKLKIKTNKADMNVTNFSDKIDLFEPGNVMNIYGGGIFQGFDFVPAPEMADFWLQDLPARSKGDTAEHMPRESYPYRAHIHVFNPYVQIHSHYHHLDPNDETMLRRFLVRCVCEDLDKSDK